MTPKPSGPNLGDLVTLETVRADEFKDWFPTRGGWKGPRPRRVPSPEISDHERRFIQAVIDNPGAPSSQLAKFAFMSPKKAQDVRQSLVERGYLREHRITTGRRGRAAIVCEPLEPALKVVEDQVGGTP